MKAVESRHPHAADPDSGPEGYESPAVVEVLCPEDLRREVHYAGVVISGPPG
jgi:hypothetical protein